MSHDDSRAREVVEKLEKQLLGKRERNFVDSDIQAGADSKEKKRKKRAWVETAMKWGMSVPQISRFTHCKGDGISERQVHRYLSDMRLPKYYDRGGGRQHLHDFFCFETFLRLAEQFRVKDLSTEVIQFNQSPGEGARFRYDFKFRVSTSRNLLFYGEVQLSDLAGTNWRKKHKNYVNWYKKEKRNFRTLWVIDQKRDMSVVRSHAREVLKDLPPSRRKLFLYITLEELRRSDNVITEKVWLTPTGERVPLVEKE